MSFKTLLISICFAFVAILQAASPAKIVGFYPYWVQYTQFYPKDVRYNLVTDIHYVGVTPTAEGAIDFTDASDAPNFEELVKQSKENGVNVVLVVGGLEAEASFKEIAASETALPAFVSAVQQWVTKYNLAGIELDWQNLTVEDKDAYTRLVQALVQAKGSSTLSLTTYPMNGIDAYDPAVLNQVDYITVFFKDQMIAESSELKANLGTNDVVNGVKLLTDAGVESSRIIPIIPLYAKTFMGATGFGSAHQGIGSGNEGFMPYKDLMNSAFNGSDYTVTFDDASQSELAVSSTQAIVFVGIPTMKSMATQVKNNGMAGLAVYDLSQDHNEPIISLLVTAGLVLRPEMNYKPAKKKK